ncbi:hypothetical protein [Halopseudomonas pelagia]|uniref:hypothetical protein n=1 Tax=Halopseudomonas pelagia TaxID=553151 RepID=UPI00039D5DE9|nr:hypothetical protein [Halopseudomonas pelagia]
MDDNMNDFDRQDDFDMAAWAPAAIGWGIAATALAIFSVTSNTSPLVLGASTAAKVFAVLLGVILGIAGALLGDALRRFARPSAVFTQGGFFSLIWIRVFWAIGPQVIGLVIGVFVGAALVLR